MAEIAEHLSRPASFLDVLLVGVVMLIGWLFLAVHVILLTQRQESLQKQEQLLEQDPAIGGDSRDQLHVAGPSKSPLPQDTYLQ